MRDSHYEVDVCLTLPRGVVEATPRIPDSIDFTMEVSLCFRMATIVTTRATIDANARIIVLVEDLVERLSFFPSHVLLAHNPFVLIKKPNITNRV